MNKLAHHLSLARRKLIHSRGDGLSFDPDKKRPKIPSLIHVKECGSKTFLEFKEKVEQARVVAFTLLPAVDEPEEPDTMVIASL